MIRFAHSEYLYAIALLPFLVILFLWAVRSRRKALEAFGNVADRPFRPGAHAAERTAGRRGAQFHRPTRATLKEEQ